MLFPEISCSVRGIVSFHQESFSSKIKITANVSGLNPNSLHGIHIHEFGDITELSKSTGGHFNPFKKHHGGPIDANKHAGDLGNLRSDERGNAYLAIEDEDLTLYGEDGILGRAVVVTAGEDDLGRGDNAQSKVDGNSGRSIGCGVIGLADRFKNLPPA